MGTTNRKGENDLTHEEHRQRHIELHQSFDELVADYLAQTSGLPSTTTLIELIVWSKRQTENPTPNPFQAREIAHAEVKRG
jgi:hypothetical protein